MSGNGQVDFKEGGMRKIGVGLVGWGTVGCGVVQVLRENAEVIESRLGVPLELRRVADQDLERERPVAVPCEMLTTNVGRHFERPGNPNRNRAYRRVESG